MIANEVEIMSDELRLLAQQRIGLDRCWTREPDAGRLTAELPGNGHCRVKVSSVLSAIAEKEVDATDSEIDAKIAEQLALRGPRAPARLPHLAPWRRVPAG